MSFQAIFKEIVPYIRFGYRLSRTEHDPNPDIEKIDVANHED
jgi:hypothetical protein